MSAAPLSKRAVDRTRNQHVTQLARQMSYVRSKIRARARRRPERWHQYHTRSSQGLGTASAGDTACVAEFSMITSDRRLGCRSAMALWHGEAEQGGGGCLVIPFLYGFIYSTYDFIRQFQYELLIHCIHQDMQWQTF